MRRISKISNKKYTVKTLFFVLVGVLWFVEEVSAQEPRLVLPEGHRDIVHSLRISHDEKMIVTIGDYTAKIWDAISGRLLQNISGHTGHITSVCFSPKDNNIITSSEDGTAIIWNVASGKLLWSLSGHTSWVESAQFSLDGKRVVTASLDSTAKIWDAESGKLLQNLEGYTSFVNSAVFSPDGKKILTASDDFTAKIWDSRSGQLVHDLVGRINFINALFSPNGNYVVTASNDSTAKIWDVASGQLLKNLTDHFDWVRSAQFSPDGRSIVTASQDNTAKIWDVASGNVLHVLKGHNSSVWTAKYSPDGSMIVTTSSSLSDSDSNAKIWDASTGILLQNLKGHSRVNSAQFSPDGRRIVTTSSSLDSTAKIWHVQTGELLLNLGGHTRGVEYAQFSPDSKMIITVSGDFTVNIWDVTSGYIIPDFKNYNKEIFLAKFSPDGKTIISITPDFTAQISDASSGELINKLVLPNERILFANFSSDGKKIITITDLGFQLWDTPSFTGQQIYSRVQLHDHNYLITLPNSKYYMCSKDASKMVHYVTDDLKVIGFEQLDPVYNRPDKVLEHISQYLDGVGLSLIDVYRGAWERRADLLGLNREMLQEGSLAVPDAEITNTNEIDYFNTSGTVDIDFSAQDAEYKLLRFNVLVNEVPLYGATGISLSKRNIQNFDTTLHVPLSVGNNKIQVSVMNDLGLENFQYPTYVNYTPTEEIPSKTLFIGIAVDSFQQESYNLSYCVKDIHDLSAVFKQQPNTEIITLTNSQVTKENVLALKERLAQTSIHDRVIISCSSHGDLDENNNFYLATHDMDFNTPATHGIPYRNLEDLLDSIPARKKLLLLDTCNSGLNDMNAGANRSGTYLSKAVTKDSTQRGASRVNIQQSNDEFQTMLELFVNVQNETGTIVVSAAGGAEAAFEGVQVNGRRLENGVFTHAILEYIRQHQLERQMISVNSLKKYVEDRVEELTNGTQKPTSRQETMEVDWEVFN